MEIARDERDRMRFALLLRHLNDEFKSENWDREISPKIPMERPRTWPQQKPLTRVLAWTLMPNHFHLLLQETRHGGVSKFMQKICNSMTSHFNRKYDEKGSIFQGAYKSRTISNEAYLHYVVPYVMLKNTLELFPGGLRAAQKQFDKAWAWGLKYPHSSLQFYATDSFSPIIGNGENILKDTFPSARAFKAASLDMFEGYMAGHQAEIYKDMLLE